MSRWSALWFWSALALTPGCISVYQPMQGLNRPVAIHMGYANFEGLKVALHCLPGAAIDRGDAQALCQKLTVLLENQGAEVQSSTRLGRVETAEEAKAEVKPEGKEEEAPKAKPAPKMDLSVELRARLIHKDDAWLLKGSTYAQDVTIRDEKGFLLLRETLVARFMIRIGFFSKAEGRFSKDFYAHISQMTLNAKLRRQVLREPTVPVN